MDGFTSIIGRIKRFVRSIRKSKKKSDELKEAQLLFDLPTNLLKKVNFNYKFQIMFSRLTFDGILYI